MALSPERKEQIYQEIEKLDKRISENIRQSMSCADSARKYELQMQRDRMKEKRARLAAERA